MATIGIAKDKTNSFQKYKFRGIDDVYNALAPIIAKHRLVIAPRILKRDVIERVTKKDEAIFYVTVEAEFDFISAIDGSKHTAKTFGEAMDSSDKATNKAMSAAYKYVAFQTFCIPTAGDNDADANHHEVKPEEKKQTAAEKAKAAAIAYIARIHAAKKPEEADAVLAEVDSTGNLNKYFPELYAEVKQEHKAHVEYLDRKGA
jgi:hypothetical protein